MNIRHSFMGLLLLAVTLSGAFAADGPAPAEFRGLKWGSAPTKSLKKVSRDVWTTGKGTQNSFLEIPVAEDAYMFENNKLFGGQLFFDGADNFSKLKRVLITQFGPPDFANNSRQIFKWKWAASGVEVTLYYQSNFQRTTISFTKK